MPLFDWGSSSKNMEKYGQATPPNVELDKIRTPVAMFVGQEDDLGDVTDCRWAKNQIKSEYMKHYEESPGGHATFMVGKDMSYFARVLDLVKQFD